jgi:hypothetical protein
MANMTTHQNHRAHMKTHKVVSNLLVRGKVCAIRRHRLEWEMIRPTPSGDSERVLQCRCGRRSEPVRTQPPRRTSAPAAAD